MVPVGYLMMIDIHAEIIRELGFVQAGGHPLVTGCGIDIRAYTFLSSGFTGHDRHRPVAVYCQGITPAVWFVLVVSSRPLFLWLLRTLVIALATESGELCGVVGFLVARSGERRSALFLVRISCLPRVRAANSAYIFHRLAHL